MKRRIHDTVLGVFGLVGIAFFALSGASCEAPGLNCAVGHFPYSYFLKYELVSGDAACYGIPGEEVGITTYLAVPDRKETTDPATGITTVTADTADYNTRNIAIQSVTMGVVLHGRLGVGTDAADVPYAFGPLTSKPDAGNLCYTGGANGTAALAPADLNIDAVDMDPAIHVRQEWNNIRFYVTAGVPGTQMVGEMKFEDVLAGCSGTYKFTGMYPAIFCGDEVHEQVDNDGDSATPVDNDTDDDGDPMTPVSNDKDDDDDPMTAVDNDDDDPANPDVDEDEEEFVRYETNNIYCDPVGDPATGRLGSGINPDFETMCDPDAFYCTYKPGTALVQ